MSTSNLDQLIQKEQEKIKGYEEKKAKLDIKVNDLKDKIKASQEKIDKYQITKDSQMHNELTKKLSNSGLSFDDIMKALQSGDMLVLQEKLEETKHTPNEDSVASNEDNNEQNNS